jgi:hypothetical protein
MKSSKQANSDKQSTAEAGKQASSAAAKKKYARFQYKDRIFKVGEVCRFFQEQNSPDLIGMIMAICSTDPQHPDFAKLKVRWYYQKKDLYKTKLTDKQLNQIATDFELFPTSHY